MRADMGGLGRKSMLVLAVIFTTVSAQMFEGRVEAQSPPELPDGIRAWHDAGLTGKA